MIRGQVIVVGQLQQGVGKTSGKEWKRQEYVIQTDGQYPKKVAFSLMNDKIAQANIQMGQTIEVELDAQSREYQGKWYTELTAWRVNPINAAPQGYAPAPTPQAAPYQQTAPQGYAAPPTAQPYYGPSNNTDLAF